MDVEGRLTGEKPNVDPTAFLLLGGDPEKKSMSAMYYQWPIVGCTVFGLGAAFFHNYMTRRPRLAGIQRHILYSLIGLGVGIGARRMQVSMQGEKDLMYFHYICLHPEDFPPPERVQFRDYLRPWIPVR